MPDYSQGKVYKIVNSITDDTYIGSGTQLLCNRMKNHRNDYKNQNSHKYNYKVYKRFRELGVDCFYIELLEKYPCETKEELLAREGYWIRQAKPSLNARIEGLTQEEDLERRKQSKQLRWEMYYGVKIPCECGCEISQKHIERHRGTRKHHNRMQLVTNP